MILMKRKIDILSPSFSKSICWKIFFKAKTLIKLDKVSRKKWQCQIFIYLTNFKINRILIQFLPDFVKQSFTKYVKNVYLTIFNSNWNCYLWKRVTAYNCRFDKMLSAAGATQTTLRQANGRCNSIGLKILDKLSEKNDFNEAEDRYSFAKL